MYEKVMTPERKGVIRSDRIGEGDVVRVKTVSRDRSSRFWGR